MGTTSSSQINRKRRLSESASYTPSMDSEILAPRKRRRLLREPHDRYYRLHSQTQRDLQFPVFDGVDRYIHSRLFPVPVSRIPNPDAAQRLFPESTHPRSPSIQIWDPLNLAAAHHEYDTRLHFESQSASPPYFPESPDDTKVEETPGPQKYTWEFKRTSPLRNGIPDREEATWTRACEPIVAVPDSDPNVPAEAQDDVLQGMSYREITHGLASEIAGPGFDTLDREIFMKLLQSVMSENTAIYHFSSVGASEAANNDDSEGGEVLCLRLGVCRVDEGRWKEAELIRYNWWGLEEGESIEQVVRFKVYVEEGDESWNMKCEDIVAGIIDADQFPCVLRQKVEKHVQRGHDCDAEKVELALAYFDTVRVNVPTVRVKKGGGGENVAVVRLEDVHSGTGLLKCQWREFHLRSAIKDQKEPWPTSTMQLPLRVKDVGGEEWDEEKSVEALTRLPKEALVDALIDLGEGSNPGFYQQGPSYYSMMFGMIISAIHDPVTSPGGTEPKRDFSTVAFEIVPASELYREFDFISSWVSTRRYHWHWGRPFHLSFRFKTSETVARPKNRERVSGLNQIINDISGASVVQSLKEYCTKKPDQLEGKEWDEDRIVRDLRVISCEGDSPVVLIESVTCAMKKQSDAVYSETFIIPGLGKSVKLSYRETPGWVLRDDYTTEGGRSPITEAFTLKVLEEHPSGLDQEMSTRQIIETIDEMKWNSIEKLRAHREDLRAKSGRPQTLWFLHKDSVTDTLITQFRVVQSSDDVARADGTPGSRRIHVLPFRTALLDDYRTGDKKTGRAFRDLQQFYGSHLDIKWDATAEQETLADSKDWFQHYFERISEIPRNRVVVAKYLRMQAVENLFLGALSLRHHCRDYTKSKAEFVGGTSLGECLIVGFKEPPRGEDESPHDKFGMWILGEAFPFDFQSQEWM